MKIGTLFTKSVLATLLLCAASEAGWNEFWGRVHLDYSRNRCWPSPFIEQDRASVRNYFDQMTATGIRLQNTLSDHHFEEDNALTHAGTLKIRQILMNTEDRRTIFVMQNLTESETQARIEAVRQGLTDLVGNPNATEIFVTSSQPAGRAADYIDDVYRRERASIPAPRLPAATE